MKATKFVLGLALPTSIVAAACGSSSAPKATSAPTTVGSTGDSAAATPATPFLSGLHTLAQIGSTVPADGDVNPYGITNVTATAGRLTQGDTLVSNFNSKANVQGTGTTIVEVSPGGSTQLFASLDALPAGLSCPGGIGLTTGLEVLPGGWVIVGSLPTANGGALPSGNPVGCLIVLNNQGTPVETFTNKDIIGPWDSAVSVSGDSAELFVSNALGGNTSTDNGVPVAGNCTIARLDLSLSATSAPKLTSTTIIGTDFPWRADQAALVLAPTGLALGANGTLYVDDTQTNSISAIPQAPTRTDSVKASSDRLTSGGALSAPLGMLMAPNGDLIVVNGNNGNAVEVSTAGQQVATSTLVNNGAGDLFGITTTSAGTGLLFVDDGTNALDSDQP